MTLDMTKVIVFVIKFYVAAKKTKSEENQKPFPTKKAHSKIPTNFIKLSH